MTETFKLSHETTLSITRGVARLLMNLGQVIIAEMSLVTGRRVDLIGIDRAGLVTIVEIKASVAGFKSDRKWQEYLEYCDLFYFAVAPGFPLELLPSGPEYGLIVGDRFDAEILREATRLKLAAARRKAVTLRFARTAATRLQELTFPVT
ncbi:MmcB family DNA repair protein [Ponticaulis sp.]|uniref:MmcB family DNA repair protein n=1 Tax=Ponticaulis sp. TaxID=2020902 RepID=UPI000C6A8209|nr:MmcB family DNA repair protein [Ponticaulis sp.]MBN06134.1 hypothetical protein [Ponticaulis sp.]